MVWSWLSSRPLREFDARLRHKRGHGEHETAAASHLALHPDPAAMKLDEALGNSQTQAGPLGFSLSIAVHLMELVEDGIEFLGGNPRARILHAAFDPRLIGGDGILGDRDLCQFRIRVPSGCSGTPWVFDERVRAETPTRPPGGVNFTAFATRLIITC